jgi:hypothetical protein
MALAGVTIDGLHFLKYAYLLTDTWQHCLLDLWHTILLQYRLPIALSCAPRHCCMHIFSYLKSNSNLLSFHYRPLHFLYHYILLTLESVKPYPHTVDLYRKWLFNAKLTCTYVHEQMQTSQKQRLATIACSIYTMQQYAIGCYKQYSALSVVLLVSCTII